MGYGLGAVETGTPGSLSLEQPRAHRQTRRAAGRAPMSLVELSAVARLAVARARAARIRARGAEPGSGGAPCAALVG